MALSGSEKPQLLKDWRQDIKPHSNQKALETCRHGVTCCASVHIVYIYIYRHTHTHGLNMCGTCHDSGGLCQALSKPVPHKLLSCQRGALACQALAEERAACASQVGGVAAAAEPREQKAGLVESLKLVGPLPQSLRCCPPLSSEECCASDKYCFDDSSSKLMVWQAAWASTLQPQRATFHWSVIAPFGPRRITQVLQQSQELIVATFLNATLPICSSKTAPGRADASAQGQILQSA